MPYPERKPIYETYTAIAESLFEQYGTKELDTAKLKDFADSLYEQFIAINQRLIAQKYHSITGIRNDSK